MEYLELHPVTPQKRFIEKAIEVLKNGGVIIYPTDTFYGMGCSIYETDALDRIFKLNNQSKVKLYSFIIPDFKDIAKYAKVSDFAFKTMKKLLPGPYTFI
ncbi:MAG: Sua5/YciO/YrdC/YwlC family protein, partial [Ignavibacteriaceae bacterium]|nr:Sua5/YciO/YrdC/YwlC family protein [Ignavibacteriaceae bacterium]